MTYQTIEVKKQENVRNSTLILIGFATAFFPRLFSYFGAPSVINFFHFIVIPFFVGIAILTTKVKDRKQKSIVGELAVGIGIFFTCTLASALINNAGVVNAFLDFMLKAEPFLLLTAVMSVPAIGNSLTRIRRWLIGFAVFNLLLAIVQSVLMPIGIYPRRGGTLQDNIAGVFAAGSGSAGNYVSCTVSFYFALYVLNHLKTIPLWIRIAGLIATIYQIQVSDSKQTFLALFLGWVLLLISNVKKPVKLLVYLIPISLILFGFLWALNNTDWAFLDAYRNWTSRDGIFDADGEATLTKTAAFRIIPRYYETPLNWLFGLGPGHSVSRLGGWVLRDYEDLLIPLGATIHPASEAVFQVVRSGWIAQESTIYFPLFTWAGIWGDLGVIGLAAYLYLGSIVWRRVCVDDFGKFLLTSTIVLGFILTQVEEPGHVLTIACLLGLRWHEQREKQLASRTNQYFLEDSYRSYINISDNDK